MLINGLYYFKIMVKSKYLIILLLLFSISAVSDIVWLSIETPPPSWDESLHLTKSLQYYDVIMSSNWATLIHIDDYYPPLYHITPTLLYLLFGTSTDVSIFQNVLYFGILLISVYEIGKYFGGTQAGLIGAVLISLYPGIIGMRRFFVIDNGVIALTALSIYMLLLTDKFKNSKHVLYFGVIAGLAMLSKWTAVFFIIPPFLILCYEGFWKEKRKPSIAFYGMIIIAVGLCLTWYWTHFMDVYTKITWGNVYWGTMEGDPDVFSIDSFIFYLRSALINSQVSFFFFLLFVVGLIKYRNQAILLSWIVIPYIIMTLMKNKNERYTMPSIAAIAVLSALWIASIKTKQTKAIVMSIILLVGVGQLVVLAVNPYFTPLMAGGTAIVSGQIYGTRPPMTDNWHTDDIADALANDIKRNTKVKGRLVYVGTVVDNAYLNGLTVGYYTYIRHLPVNSISVTDFEATQPFIDNFLNFDYLILKDGVYYNRGRKQIMIEMNDYFYKHIGGWTQIAQFTLPDQSNATIYRNDVTRI